jgi:2-pyrone-4,6-dicarboxylate lactonase
MTPGMPADAVDVHAHVLDPARTGTPGAAYALFDASLGDYEQHLDRLGIQRGVLVTASVHGTDNEPVLDALSRSRKTLRGVAVVGADVTRDELERLHARGIRAIRLQDRFAGGTPLSALGTLGQKVHDLGWHIEIWTDFARHLSWLPHAIASCRVPVVLDHFGFLGAEVPDDHDAMRTVVTLAREQDTWVTLSGAYRLASDVPPAAAGETLLARVRYLAEAVPGHLLWGSDWPFVAPPREAPDAGDLRAELDLWLPEPALRQRVLVTNPVKCYGFGP